MIDRSKALVLLGKNLRREREFRHLTQEALAELENLDSTYISGIERGTRNPSLISIARIASGLNLTVSKLTEGIK